MTEVEMANARQNLVDLAVSQALDLRKIYVERIESAPDAFDALLTEVTQGGVERILVPGLHHLAVIGDPRAIRNDLQKDGVDVLIARHID
ncbi:hypothetical protein OG394_06075 [Kribbella sp. NBC_01245]|uniref:hypothetical protein n=1 Tax=Kribbella sp. NBC_01245 TaxID=2903578 RepID=UPI002E2AAC1B|nr:hypothetical protein [Kribbella sp. NBC_01245]